MIRVVRLAAAALVVLVAGCGSTSGVAELDPVREANHSPAGALGVLQTLLVDLHAHFLGTAEPTSVISAGATLDVAVTELTEALDLGDGASDFAAATAFELSRVADESEVTSVAFTVAEPAAVGSKGGRDVYTVTIDQEITHQDGPIVQSQVEYAIVTDGTRLESVLGWHGGLDSGVGLDSPLGSAARFVDLVRAADWEAVRYFSGGQNDNATALEVLRSVLEGSGGVEFVELPEFRVGSERVVYALNSGGRVVARFDITLGQEPRVVYSPTA